jgi:iron complex transport system substrate-binding protein
MRADYWLHPNSINTLDELQRNDPRYATIPAFRQHRVFNNSLRSTPQGGSDFWESGVVRPHIILRDVISILHPDLLPEHRLVYYKQLQ